MPSLQNRDTIDVMIENDIGAMLVFTVTMGLTAIIMAWCIFVGITRGWAERRENIFRGRKVDVE